MIETDVVVVGSGAGALTGAYAAASRGLEVVVLEKTDRLGGTSAYSGAACWLPDTQVQRRDGLDDSAEAARTYLTGLLPASQRERVDALIDTAPALVAELETHPRLTFQYQAFPDYVDAAGRHPQGRSIVPVELDPAELGDRLSWVRPPVHRDRRGRGHDPDRPLDGGRALIGRLLLACLDAGVEVRRETPMRRLTADESGAVTGVVAETVDGEVELRARRGVLLAAGGFESDPRLRAEHRTPGRADWTMGPDGANTGDALRAAVEVGAATDLLDEAWWCPGLAQPDGGVGFLLGFRSGILVDQHGRRFANESRPYDQMGRVLAADPDARMPCWMVFDAREGGALPAIALPPGRVDDHLAAGTWVEADTVAGLAERAGLPADALEETVERFNAMARAGVDEDFARGEDPFDRFFAAPGEHPNPCLHPLEQGPLRAANVVLGDLGTKGGLVTDVDARVLDEQGAPIAGLYAGSNTVASLSGHVYPGPGIPLGTAMVAGYRAAQHLAG